VEADGCVRSREIVGIPRNCNVSVKR
jgi:hypothetical protein